MKRLIVILWLLVIIPLLASPSSTSAQGQRSPRLPDFLERTPSTGIPEFTFTRLRYSGYGGRGYGRRGGSWATDWPKADYQFIYGLRGWARSLLNIGDEPATVSALDPEIFQYPFLYIVEPGRMYLSDEEATRLREYLTRGGFLILDDFWGTYEWENVQEQMRKIFPDRQIQELPLDHPIFHCYFDVEEVVQVPQVDNWIYNGRTHEQDGFVPHYEGIIDENGRVVVFIARNTDNGDAWEWIDEPQYPLRYGLAAYRLGMNVIIYAMTH
ncbi:MAG TPA: DUF4159 domain-containing protein [Blastocatellia bacterium]|nr:DUF4159 domain-containing protein [Blastocatellia bacterium]